MVIESEMQVINICISQAASSWLCLFKTLQWPRHLRLDQHKHQQQGHHHQGDQETDKASPQSLLLIKKKQELEKNGRE